MLEGVFYHLPCSIIEDEFGFILTNIVGQVIIFLDAKENKIRMSKYKAIKI
jgi:hypothetical protein